MPSVNREWVAEQLTKKKTQRATGNAVIALLATWESQNLTPKQAQDAAELFSKLAVGIPVVDQAKPNEVWIEARPGAIKVGDEVMVKVDAFTSDAGAVHNGRRGRVVAVRYGDIIVDTTDDLDPVLKGTHYSPAHLLKLVQQ